jgi:hypothetical protein
MPNLHCIGTVTAREPEAYMLFNALIDKDIRLVIWVIQVRGNRPGPGIVQRVNIAHLDLDTLAWLPMGEYMAGISACLQCFRKLKSS